MHVFVSVSLLDVLVLVVLVHRYVGAARLQLPLDGVPELLLVHGERQIQFGRIVLLKL